MELTPGLVVDLQKIDTRGFSTDRFMKEMGDDPTGLSVNSISPDDGVDSQASSEYGHYIESIRQANAFALAMSAKGIDVTQPSSRNPDSLIAAQRYNDLKSDISGQAISLRSSAAMRKATFQESMKKGIIGRGLDSTLATDKKARQSLIKTSGFTDMINTSATSIKGLGKSYSTEAERDMANRQIDEKINKAKDNYRQEGLRLGLTNEEIEGELARFDSIPKATTNFDAVARLGMAGEKHKSGLAKDRATIRNANARTNKVLSGEASDEESNAMIDEIIKVMSASPEPGNFLPSDLNDFQGSAATDVLNGQMIHGKEISSIIYKDGKPTIIFKGKMGEKPPIPMELNATNAAELFSDAKTRNKFLQKVNKQDNDPLNLF